MCEKWIEQTDTKILLNPIEYKEIIHHMNILCIWTIHMYNIYTYIIYNMQVTEKDFSLEKHLNILIFLVSEQCIGINKIILWIKAYVWLFFLVEGWMTHM